MITIPTDYIPSNPSVQKFTYTITLNVTVSGFTSFAINQYITDSQRSAYNYTSAAKIVGLGFKLVNYGLEYASSSTMDVASHLRLTYDNTVFNPVGNTSSVAVGSTNTMIVATLMRSTAGSNLKSLATSSSELYFQTLTNSIATVASTLFALKPYNASASVLSSADVVQITFQISEYISRY